MEVVPATCGLSERSERFNQPLAVLAVVAAVLLLLTSLNITGMLLARATSRAKEMAVRLGLGASKERLVRQVFTETLLLSVAGALAGAVIAYLGTAALLRILASGRPHERIDLTIVPDPTLLLFPVGLTLLTGLVCGLAPAWAVLQQAPAEAMRQTGRATGSPRTRFVARLPTSIRVAFSVVLLSAAALFVAHLKTLQSADLGFRRENVLLVTLEGPRAGLRGQALSDTYRNVLDRVRSVPGVRSASLAAPTPLMGAGASAMGTFEGFEERLEDKRWISVSYASLRYFETLETRLLAGRDFTLQDQANPNVVIMNRTLASQYFAGRNPIGKSVTLERLTGRPQPVQYEIIGVVADANYMGIRESSRRGLFLPAFANGRVTGNKLVVRTVPSPSGLAPTVLRAIHEVAPSVPVSDGTTLSAGVLPNLPANISTSVLAGMAIFFAAAVAATWFPARRAARINPVDSLRAE